MDLAQAKPVETKVLWQGADIFGQDTRIVVVGDEWRLETNIGNDAQPMWMPKRAADSCSLKGLYLAGCVEGRKQGLAEERQRACALAHECEAGALFLQRLNGGAQPEVDADTIQRFRDFGGEEMPEEP